MLMLTFLWIFLLTLMMHLQFLTLILTLEALQIHLWRSTLLWEPVQGLLRLHLQDLLDLLQSALKLLEQDAFNLDFWLQNVDFVLPATDFTLNFIAPVIPTTTYALLPLWPLSQSQAQPLA